MQHTNYYVESNIDELIHILNNLIDDVKKK